jgi:hypothetical protein
MHVMGLCEVNAYATALTPPQPGRLARALGFPARLAIRLDLCL